MRRIFTELRQLIDHPMKLRSSNFGLAHYALSFHNGSNQNGKYQQKAVPQGISEVDLAGKQKYWRCSKDKEGCGGAVWTDLEVPAGIDRKDHVETCRVDEHMAL
ncbi:hypothetical protein T03_1284 [Trichinella britovi]|uniref:FLYWCH-type domain-containing protein n=1 Tax=Trichinella britovi TaxID=45882 RepID=A0A0V1CQ19_TRIBR|nr:hypothetical protein T03_1284 [Trichinella britovi]